jgi:hypothetical protein
VEHYAGFEVSLELTSVCVGKAQGQMVREELGNGSCQAAWFEECAWRWHASLASSSTAFLSLAPASAGATTTLE